MNRYWLVVVLSLPAAAQTPERPRHLFRPEGRLSGPSAAGPRQAARDFLRSISGEYQLRAADVDAARIAGEYTSEHNGVTHLAFRQQFQGIEVDNAEWTVNIDSEGRVINAGGALAQAPADGAAPPDGLSAMSAVRTAAKAVNARLAQRFAPVETGVRSARGVRFAGSVFPAEIEGLPVWWEHKGMLRPAWKFGITDEDRITRWAVVVDSETRQVLAKRPLTWRQQGPRGLVFEKGNPQPNPTPGVLLAAPPPVVERTMQTFAGDPAASPKGWVEGSESAGNNIVAGTNTLGIDCFSSLDCFVRPKTSRLVNGAFSFPLDVKASPALFPDASTTSLFYWANRAHDWFYSLGFNEAAGNYQKDNFNRGGVDGDPIVAYALYGATSPEGADLNNAFFINALQASDGSQAQMAFLIETADGRYYDNSQDAETVIHEYAHGVSNRLVRQLNASHHGGSLGEGWSDFLALEMLTPEGAPPDGAYPFSEYPDQLFGRGIRTRPYSTDMGVNPLTFGHLGRVVFRPEIHADGEIWAAALWEMRAGLIRQFGEREGRRRARLLTIDGMKLSPPGPSMLDARDAILLADQVTFKGESQQTLWTAFAKRGMGALAMCNGPDTIHIRPSFEVPSPRGSIAFYEDRYVQGERVRMVVQDSNLTGDTVRVQVVSTAGDLENVILWRKGQVFAGSLETGYAPAIPASGMLELIAGDFVSAYYNDYNAPGGTHLAQASVPVSLDYDWNLKTAGALRFAGERALRMAFVPYLPYELPWPFPFFGESHKQVWVHNNGLLSFGMPGFAACPDTYGLWVTKGIAPLWMNLATDGAAQSGEDVYASQGPDWVTFRWAAETAPDFIGSRPEAVNFAATLYRDGRITFQYGAGNRNLTAGSNWLGCNASVPIVGISNGHESFIEPILTHDGKGTLEAAPTVVLDPPFNPSSAPVIRLESPAAGAKVKGVLSGSGIAYDPDPESAIREIDVLVDGIVMEVASTGRPRTDFCNAQRVQGCPNVGFTFSLPVELNKLKPGEHTLQLRAVNRRGYFVDVPERPLTFTVEPQDELEVVAAIETPADGQTVSGTIPLRGHAYSPTARLVAVDVLSDGVILGTALLTGTRADICGPLSPAPPNCPRAGFAVNLDTRGLTNGPHTLALRVEDDSGRFSGPLPGAVAITVNNNGNELPSGALVAPAAGQKWKGTVRISGHAWAPGGTVTRVRLLVDEFPMADLTYGSPRPEVCAGLEGVRACPNIGFEGEFDTTRLSNGPHYINVVIDDTRGNRIKVPRTISGGVDVTVDN